MKNIIIVDIDTERDQIVVIGKPETFPQPQNKEEAAKLVSDDILGLCEGLIALINASDRNGYRNAPDSLKDVINHLQDGVKETEIKK